MRKKFYTFAELKNYIDILEKNMNTSLQFRIISKEFEKWFRKNIDPETRLLFILYRRGDVDMSKVSENIDMYKVYPTTMWSLDKILL